MNTTLRSVTPSREGLADKRPAPTDDAEAKIRRREGEDRHAARWFDAAAKEYGANKVTALDLGVSENHVSDMRSGDRSTPLRALRPLLAKRASALALINALCDEAGLPHVRATKRIDHKKVKRRAVTTLRAIGPVWEALRGQLATEMGTSEEEIEWAADENTAEIALDPTA